MVGRTLAHYRIVEKLGEGGMGVVYKARDAHLGRYAALKLLLPDKVADPERKRRFVQEAKAASSLNHPNIVTIYDIASEDGIDFIAMEFVPGKTLDQLIPRKGMRLNEVLQYAVQMADALAAAHEAGIVHRDLKPGNVMVSDKGLVKVVDFGLAKLMEPRLPVSAATVTLESAPKTVEGAIVGTVAYMSPEQTEGKPVDARSDIFSFGSMLYEMVTGQRPFRRGSTESTLAAIQHEEPPALDVNSPHDLDVLITRCLRKASERRWQAMADLKVALQDLKEETDSGKLMAPKAARPVRRLLSPILFAGLTVILVGAAVGVFWRMRPGVDTGADTGVEAATVVPLTSFPTLEQHPSLSPDGNQVAFSWNGPEGSNFDIYVKQVDGPGLARLTTDPASDANPAWSPDGKWIAFTRADSGIVLISPIGGPERKLVSTVSRPSWTPDSQSLVFTGDAPPGRARAVVLLSLATGIRKPLTAPPKDYWGDASPAISPDGQLLAFTRSPG
ncbi:MAG: serine/threonine-protein kinase, partial [Acidobacteriia bacterium]|nr:serine/threonine-protein kinase [Terriglobia bacterium]